MHGPTYMAQRPGLRGRQRFAGPVRGRAWRADVARVSAALADGLEPCRALRAWSMSGARRDRGRGVRRAGGRGRSVRRASPLSVVDPADGQDRLSDARPSRRRTPIWPCWPLIRKVVRAGLGRLTPKGGSDPSEAMSSKSRPDGAGAPGDPGDHPDLGDEQRRGQGGDGRAAADDGRRLCASPGPGVPVSVPQAAVSRSGAGWPSACCRGRSISGSSMSPSAWPSR
jgi:hypothetical protein